ncbi:neuronal acetylcholine receptor subunit alpha-10 isoform X2 [Nematostella vectensis]|uniref:neuronal acetylcholine receptor subunit alpha-10 isoform X2 n=1 Tax=Nematostella vectensis TaxID=45351 RepID=UPI0020770ACE|nr:neuronal acetylcholine receptor subunit alpha-10 isoform X2 [Nematostella vectensis]
MLLLIARCRLCFSFQYFCHLYLEEKNMVFTTNVRLRMGWKDAFLQWNPADYGGVTQINLEASDIWTPPVIIYNQAGDLGESITSSNTPRPVVRSDGTVLWMVPTVIKSSCVIDVKYFPFDQQLCKIIFGSWHYDVSKLDLQPLDGKVDTTRYITNSEWKLLSATAVRTQVSHICCRQEVARITYSLHIERRRLYYSMNFILPCTIIAFLMLLVFMTPDNTGERMAVGVTILLSLAVFFLMLETIMPISQMLPLLGKYYCCIIIEGAAALGAMSGVLRYIHHSPDPLPPWVKKYILGHLARLMFYDMSPAPRKIQVQNSEEIDLNEKDENTRQLKFAVKWRKRVREKKQEALPSPETRAIIIVAEKIKEQGKTAELQGQWEQAANVINRFLTCLFLLSILITIIAVLVLDVPRFDFSKQ